MSVNSSQDDGGESGVWLRVRILNSLVFSFRTTVRAIRGSLREADQSFSVSRRIIGSRSEEHTSELQSQSNLVCRLLLEKKKKSTLLRRSFSRRSPAIESSVRSRRLGRGGATSARSRASRWSGPCVFRRSRRPCAGSSRI